MVLSPGCETDVGLVVVGPWKPLGTAEDPPLAHAESANVNKDALMSATELRNVKCTIT